MVTAKLSSPTHHLTGTTPTQHNDAIPISSSIERYSSLCTSNLATNLGTRQTLRSSRNTFHQENGVKWSTPSSSSSYR